MKVIPVFIAMAASALAATHDPGETAVHFLEKVRTKKLNLDPGADTALSPQTSEKKRREISRRLERMARDLGSEPLEVGAVKTDGDLAAVLVRKSGGFDPTRLQVFPVALVKRGTGWSAAPVPASFENSGVGYAAALRARLASLEEWMLRQQVIDLENLREQSAATMRRKIEEILPAATLRGLSANQAADRFLSACERRNLPEILGLLGGLASPLPADWSLRLKAAETALSAGTDVTAPWRLLISSDVLRALVDKEEDRESATVSIACLDPASTRPIPHIQLVNLEIMKSEDGLWRIDPPQRFFADGPDSSGDDSADSDLLDRFPGKLAALHPPEPQPSPAALEQKLLSALRDGASSAALHFIRLDGTPASEDSCIRAAQTWWALHDPAAIRRPLPLAGHETGGRAIGLVQFFSARNPLRLDLKFFYYEKSESGWLWTPKPDGETENLFRDWTEAQTQRWQEEWQDSLLAGSTELEKLPDDGAPTEPQARELIAAWLKAIRSGDVMASLHFTARIKSPESTANLLRNLGYEITGARQSTEAPEIVGVRRGKTWTAVGVRTNAYGNISFPLYPVIQTPAGPRILLETDLIASGNRSRDFLNKAALERLEKLNPAASGELKKLLADHQADVTAPPRP